MAQPGHLSLEGRTVAFTTPQTTDGGGGYGGRLGTLLRQRGAHPLPVPTIAIRGKKSKMNPELVDAGAFKP